MFEDILGHTSHSLHHNSKVALLFSGGVDSTILYWALRVLSHHLRFDLTTYTVENRVGYEDHVRNIRGHVGGLHIKTDDWHEGIDNGDRWDGNIDTAIKGVLLSMKHDYVFTGATANPPHEIPNAPERMTRKQIQNIPTLVCPFIDKTKDYVFGLYKKYNLMNLYEMTHSCTNLPVGECGRCFQCIEKLWAEQQHGHTRS
jgi:hypothetical protein